MKSWLWAVLASVLVVTPLSAMRFEGWRVQSTEHFSFIYEPHDQGAINELITYAEEVYAQVTEFIGSRPPHVDVVVYGRSDYGNGYFSPLPPAHIGLYVTPPTQPLIGVRTESWLRGSLIHELAHYVQFEYQSGPLAALGRVFSPSLPGLSILFAPIWLVEGTAVLAESELGRGGRGDDAFFEMTYKAPIIEGSMFSLAQAGYISHLAPNGRYYVGGYVILDHIAQTYGLQAVGEISRRYAAFPFFGVAGAIRGVTGKSPRDLFDDMVAELGRRFDRGDAAELWSPNRPGDYYLPNATERGLFLYRQRPDRRSAIVRITGGGDASSPGATEVPIVPVLLTDPSSWSVDAAGQTVYFTSFDVNNLHPAGQSIETNIYRHSVSTGVTEQLTRGGGYNHPAVSPDGERLLVVEIAGVGTGIETTYRRLVMFGVTGDGLASKEVLLDWRQSSVHNPAISPAGNLVAAAVNSHGRQDIVLIDLHSRSVTVLEMDDALSAEYYPRFVDDSTLYFASDRGGELSVYELKITDGAVRRIVNDRVGAYAAVLIDDELLFATYTGHGFGVRIAHSVESAEPITGANLKTVSQTLRDVAVGDGLTPGPGGVDSSSVYFDLPIPRYWYPYVEIAGGQASPLDLGVGVTAGGSGVLQRNSWITQAAYFPLLRQAQARAQWVSIFMPISLGAESQLLYATRMSGDNLSYLQSLTETLSLSVGVLSDYHLGLRRSATVAASIRHVLEYSSPSPFSIDQSFSGGLGPPSYYLFWSLGGTYSSAPTASQRAFFPGWAAAYSLAFGSGVPGLGSPPPGLQTRLSARANLPLGFLDHVITLAVSATHSTDIATRSPVSLRGWGAPTDHTLTETLPGSAVLSVGYRAPLGLTDTPLGLGLYLLGFGLSFFTETTVGFAFDAPTIERDRYAAAGVELLTLLGWRDAIPLSVGVSTVFDPTFTSPPIWPRDLRFLFAIEVGDSLIRTPFHLDPIR